MNPRRPANIPRRFPWHGASSINGAAGSPVASDCPENFGLKPWSLRASTGSTIPARALGLKYEPLKKHLEVPPPGASGLGKARPEFLELLSQERMPSSLACKIELDDGQPAKDQEGLPDPASVACPAGRRREPTDGAGSE